MPDPTLAEFVLARLADAVDDAERGYLKAPELVGWTGWDKSTAVGLPPAVAAMVLADLAAKRQLIALLFRHAATVDREWGCGHTADQIRAGQCEDTPVDGIEGLRLLALSYAGHEGYRAEWAPDAP